MFAWCKRTGRIATDRPAAAPRTRRTARLTAEPLEGRALLATLAPVPNVTVPQFLGYQVPLDGGAGRDQTYTVTSSNPAIGATIARGNFMTINVTHASSGPNDPAFAGTMTYQLFEDLTPLTVSRIEQLVEQGFYTGKNFHRIAAGFPGPNDYIVQGGSVDGSGSGEVNQPGFPFADEFNTQLAFTGEGQLAMANSGDDTNSSQFFATTGSPRFLDFQHTIFGQLVSGQQTLDLMTQVAKSPSNPTAPLSPVLISGVTLSPTNPDGVVHVDAKQAPVGATSTITVTARDPADSTTTSRSFTVNVAANPLNERPFLQPVQNQVVGLTKSSTPVQGQTAVFQIQGVNPSPQNQDLVYIVRGGKTGSGQTATFTQVQNATATVDANGVVRVVPNPGFTGVINLLVGVRSTNPPNQPAEAVDNYDTQAITLTVASTGEINLPPIALPGTATAPVNTPTPIALRGDTANPASQQTLSYELITQPTNGTVAQFNASAGTFTYVPNANFQGTDTVTFRVRDVGNPTPNLTSETATFTITVGGLFTGNGASASGSTRLIGNVLVVTPPPRTDSVPNTINIRRTTDDRLIVDVNGQIDTLQLRTATATTGVRVNRIVVFGTKSDDQIQVAPDVRIPATLDGGHGGTNTIQAGAVSTRIHAWFGRNRVTGSPQKDQIIGRAGRFRVRPTAGGDLVFAGVPRRRATLHDPGQPPGGTFYRSVGNRLIPITPPPQNH
jgi:cyclophilin family peptidyl-prolyl cis-trans isomerase